MRKRPGEPAATPRHHSVSPDVFSAEALLMELNEPSGSGTWFSRSWLSKSDDKIQIVLLLKYYAYNRGATAQTLSAGGPGLIAPGGTPGKIKWPELGVTELRFRDRLDPADSD